MGGWVKGLPSFLTLGRGETEGGTHGLGEVLDAVHGTSGDHVLLPKARELQDAAGAAAGPAAVRSHPKGEGRGVGLVGLLCGGVVWVGGVEEEEGWE